MKIAIVRHSIRNRGADRSLFAYADFLIREGHSILYYTNEVQTSLKYNPAIHFKHIPFAGKGGTVLFTVLTAFKEDLVLVDLVAMACLAWPRNRRKLVYTARDYD